jgi:hypothetical protein
MCYGCDSLKSVIKEAQARLDDMPCADRKAYFRTYYRLHRDVKLKAANERRARINAQT